MNGFLLEIQKNSVVLGKEKSVQSWPSLWHAARLADLAGGDCPDTRCTAVYSLEFGTKGMGVGFRVHDLWIGEVLIWAASL